MALSRDYVFFAGGDYHTGTSEWLFFTHIFTTLKTGGTTYTQAVSGGLAMLSGIMQKLTNKLVSGA